MKRLPKRGRTLLFKSISEALQMAHWVNQKQSPPVDELLEIKQSILTTRRKLLKNSVTLGLAAGSAALAAALGNKVAATNPPKIVIVGAGIAGLNAAYELKKAGYGAEIYEAAQRLGGRMYTLQNVLGEGLNTNIGGEFVDSEHQEIRALAKEFGIPLLDKQDKSQAKLKTGYFFQGKNYSEKEIIEAFRPIAAQIEAAHQSIRGDLVDYRHEANAQGFDRLSIAEYLQKIGATGWVRDLLDVAYKGEYGLEIGQQSALNLILVINTDLTKGFEIFGDSDERYIIEGGSQRITDQLARRLRGQINSEHRLEAIKSKDHGFTLTFARPGGFVIDVDADFVIMTIPFSTLRQVELSVELPPIKIKAIKELGYGTNAKVGVGFNQRHWQTLGFNGEVYTDENFQLSWDGSQLQSGKAGAITFFLGGDEGVSVASGTTAAHTDRYVTSFEKVFPGISSLRNGKQLRIAWSNYPFTLGSYSCYLPGQWTTIGNSQFFPVGNLYFAGEHCSYDYQGYMNGGAETGKKAAQILLKTLKKS